MATHTHSLTQNYTPIQTHIHIPMYITYTHKHTHIHTQSHTHRATYTHTHRDRTTPIHTHTHTHTHRHTNTHSYRHTCSHPLKNSHTQTPTNGGLISTPHTTQCFSHLWFHLIWAIYSIEQVFEQVFELPYLKSEIKIESGNVESKQWL